MLDQISIDAFEPLVGTSLRLSSGPHHSDLELVEAHRLKSPSPRELTSFALVLRDNGAQRAAAQGIYQLHHPTLGALDLFVVPVGPDSKGMCYEITFN